MSELLINSKQFGWIRVNDHPLVKRPRRCLAKETQTNRNLSRFLQDFALGAFISRALEPDHHDRALRTVRADEFVIAEASGNKTGLEKIQRRFQGGIVF
jgi:hypothetical protein